MLYHQLADNQYLYMSIDMYLLKKQTNEKYIT